jgi:ketosteroid isomerase-like protein
MRVVAVAVVIVWTLAGSTLHAQNAAADRETLKRLSVEWMDAVERKDRAALERLLAPDFQLLSSGEPEAGVGRAEWLRNALRMDWQSRGYSNVRVDVNGDVALVTSNYSFRVDPGGWKPAVSASGPLADVWVRNGGRWQVQRRYLAGNSIVRWADRVVGFIAGIVLFGSVLLARRFLAR